MRKSTPLNKRDSKRRPYENKEIAEKKHPPKNKKDGGTDNGGRSFLNKKMSRREFIKKGLLTLAGLGLGAYGLSTILERPEKATGRDTFQNSAPAALWKWSKEASEYVQIGESSVKCGLCPHRCLLEKNGRGICRARVNHEGKLYTLTYGNPNTVHTDPIEKKPFFHFLPGTDAFSLATAGCNLRCLYCQNWQISQSTPEETKNYDLMPEAAVEAALAEKAKNPGVRSVAFTYAEPAAFYDYALDTAKIAREHGLKAAVVSAGYLNEGPLKTLARNADAIKIDLKGFNENFYRRVCSAELECVLDSIKAIRRTDAWLEIVNLVVPTQNDDMEEIRQMSEWIRDNTGRGTPLHFSRFTPLYKMTNLPPTPVSTLEKARDVALDSGLKYVYVGNVPGHDAENTYCPTDGALCIERKGYVIAKNTVEKGRCKECGEKIPGVWA